MPNEYDNILQSGSLTVPEQNEYDELAAGVEQNKASGLKSAFTEASKTTPEAAAEVDDLADQTGLPVDVIERNKETVKQKAALDQNDYDLMLQKSPVTAKYFEDHAFAKVAREDANRLPIWEQFSQGISDTGEFYQAGKDINRTGELGHLKMFGQLTDIQAKELSTLEAKSPREQHFGTLYDVITNTAELTGQFIDPAIASLERGAAGALAGGTAAAIAGQVGPQVALPEEVVTVPLAATVGFSAGSLSYMADHAYRIESGHAFLEFEKIKDDQGNPIDPAAVRAAANVVGAINAGLEVSGLSLVAKATGVTKLTSLAMRKQIPKLFQRQGFRQAFTEFSKRYATAWGGEVSTEIMQEGTNMIVGELLKMSQEGEDVTFNNSELSMAEAASRLGSIAYKVGTGMIIPAGGASTVNLAIDTKKAIQARDQQRLFEALGQSAQDTKLRELAPKRFQEFVAEATKDGPVENIFIKADDFNEYFQSQGIDPKEAAAEIGVQDYDEASASGGDLKISTADYATTVAATDHHQGLIRHARFKAEDMSLAESEQYQQNYQAELEAEAERIVAQEEERSRVDTPVDAFYTQLRNQLSNAGRTPSAAASEASLVAAMFKTEAERSGRPAQELIDQWKVRVQREFPEALQVDTTDFMIEALRDRRFVAPSTLRGPSLGEFLIERGGVQETGGEFAARDLQRLGRRRLVTDEGLALDDAIVAAREAGFEIPEGIEGHDALLDALAGEAAGEALRSPQLADQLAIDREAALDDLAEYLDQIGLNIQDASNKEVKDAINKGYIDDKVDLKALKTFYQGDRDGTETAQTDTNVVVPDSDDRRAASESGEVGGADAGTEATELDIEAYVASLGPGQLRDPENVALAKHLWDTEGTDSPFFRKWFGQSVTEVDGEPVLFYHGTDRVINDFDIDKPHTDAFHAAGALGHFFAKDRDNAAHYGDNVLEGYVRLENPFELTDDKWLDFTEDIVTVEDALAKRQELIDKGHDGIIITGINHAVVFDGQQFKSNTNRGTFEEDGRVFYQRDYAQKNAIGLYSAAEKAVLDMPLPAWKSTDTKYVVLITGSIEEFFDTREQAEAYIAEKPEENQHLFSIAQQEETKPANGNEIWSKLTKTPGVKKEELSWLGLEEYLLAKDERGKPKKFTREEVTEFIRQNGVVVEETVGRETEGSTTEEFDWTETIDDDSENWTHRVDDYIYEYERTSIESDEFYFWDWEQWIENNLQTIIDNYTPALDDEQTAEIEAIDEGQALIDWIIENDSDPGPDILKMARSEFEEAAEEAAETEYLDNPYVSYHDAATDISIYGNDDVGYTINGERQDIYSFNEAEIRATELAHEDGLFVSEEDAEVARWQDYIWNGTQYTNYREQKLILPDIEAKGREDEFYETAHFPDANIVAFVRADDRNLRIPTDEKVNLVLEEAPDAEELATAPWIVRNTDTGEIAGPYQRETAEAVLKTHKDDPKIEKRNSYFIDELQSDWHQQGRQLGYQQGVEDPGILDDQAAEISADTDSLITDIFDMVKVKYRADPTVKPKETLDPLEKLPAFEKFEIRIDNHFWNLSEASFKEFVKDYIASEVTGSRFAIIKDGKILGDEVITDEQKAYLTEQYKERGRLNNLAKAERQGVLDAPFKDDAWLTLAVKRALVTAAEEGYGAFSWADSNVLTSRWSERYKTLYQTQYDRKMPSIVKKLTGAKPAHLNLEGKDHVHQEEGYWTIELTDELKNKIKEEGFTLFQEEGKKGSVTFGDETIIRLLESSDMSTFLHESGHLFLEVLKDLSTGPDASAQIQQDYQTALRFLGVKPGQEIQVEHHEKFARAFEAYLFEGKAPSVELQSIFQRFRAWLLNVYQRIQNLDVELNDEIRGVFDRMLATDAEIASAQQQARTDPLFKSAEDMGVSRETYQAYVDSAQKATDDATRELERKAVNEVRREAKSWWQKQWDNMRADVEEEIAARPVYQAIRFFNGDQLPAGMERLQLSKQDLIDMYDGPEALNHLRHHGVAKRSMYTVEGGVHPNSMADMFGYKSGDEMIQDIINTPRFKETVKQETDKRMKDRHGDMLSDGSMAEEALDALHTDERGVFLETELKILSDRIRRPAFPAKQAQAIAEAVMGRKLIRDANRKGQYHIAEVKAAKAAERAMLEGNMEEATNQKRHQLLNHYLYREALKVSEEVDKTLRYLGKFEKMGTRRNLAQDYMDQIDSMLEPFDLRRTVTVKELQRRKNLRDWIDAKTAEGEEVIIDPDQIERAKLKHYKEMTVDEFLAMRDAVKNIEHLARLKQKLLQQKGKREFNEVVETLVDSARENNKWSPVPLDFAPTRFKRYQQWTKEFVAEHVKMEFLYHQIDGQKAGGAFWTHLFKPLADAETAEQVMQEDMVKKLNDAFNAYSKLERDHLFKERRFYIDLINVPEMDKSFSKGALMSMALNWGNEGNRQALMNGYGWSPAQVEAALDHLTANDWQVVQKIWDAIDTLWPEIAKLQKELSGVVPEKIQPTTVQTKYGDFAGGYYPLKYNEAISHDVFRRQEREQSADLFETNWMRPATRKGHTIERAKNVSLPVKLEMSVLSEHVNNVIHDITHRKAIMDVDRLVLDPRIREAVESTAGRELYREIRPWLQAIAREQNQLSTSLEKLIGHFRVGGTIVNMGWKVTTAIVQPLGYFNSVELMGEKYAWRGLKQFYGNPLKVKEKADAVFAKSVMMRNRQKTFDRDVRDALKRHQKGGLEYSYNQTLLAHIGFFDMMVSLPTWIGTYEKATAEGATDLEAIDQADSMVRMSQSAGGAKDLAAIQRGGQFKRALTMFYSYFSVLFNQMRRRGQITIAEKNIPRAISGFLYLVVLPAVLSEIITGRAPDDDEEFPEWLAKTIGGYPFQSMVGVRDVASALTTDYGYGITPVAQGIESVLRGVGALGDALPGDDEFDRTDVKNIWIGTGYLLHLPSRQTWTMIDEILDTSEGHDFSLFEFLVTRDKEER